MSIAVNEDQKSTIKYSFFFLWHSWGKEREEWEREREKRNNKAFIWMVHTSWWGGGRGYIFSHEGFPSAFSNNMHALPRAHLFQISISLSLSHVPNIIYTYQSSGFFIIKRIFPTDSICCYIYIYAGLRDWSCQHDLVIDEPAYLSLLIL